MKNLTRNRIIFKTLLFVACLVVGLIGSQVAIKTHTNITLNSNKTASLPSSPPMSSSNDGDLNCFCLGSKCDFEEKTDLNIDCPKARSLFASFFSSPLLTDYLEHNKYPDPSILYEGKIQGYVKEIVESVSLNVKEIYFTCQSGAAYILGEDQWSSFDTLSKYNKVQNLKVMAQIQLTTKISLRWNAKNGNGKLLFANDQDTPLIVDNFYTDFVKDNEFAKKITKFYSDICDKKTTTWNAKKTGHNCRVTDFLSAAFASQSRFSNFVYGSPNYSNLFTSTCDLTWMSKISPNNLSFSHKLQIKTVTSDIGRASIKMGFNFNEVHNLEMFLSRFFYSVSFTSQSDWIANDRDTQATLDYEKNILNELLPSVSLKKQNLVVSWNSYHE